MPLPTELYPELEHPASASARIDAFGLSSDALPLREAVKANAKDGRFGPSLECASTKLDLELRSLSPAVLGTTANSSSPPPQQGLTYGHAAALYRASKQHEAQNLRTVHRYAMQSAARVLLGPEARVWHCLRSPSWNSDGVECYHIPAVKGARLGGLQTCGSVWGCPVCAAKITERRRVELRSAVDVHRANGGEVVLVTYTFSHHLGQDLAELCSKMMLARSRSMSGAPYQRVKKLGIHGSVRAIELTHGQNGWHPHIHELLFLAPGVDASLVACGLGKLWHKGVAAAGLTASGRHGFHWVEAGDEVEQYIAKWGHEPTAPVWDCTAEVTKHPAKLSKGDKGRSPMQLLADFTATGDYEAGDLYRVYAQSMKGRRQLEWSRWDTGERTDKGRAKTISFLTHLLPEVEEVSDMTLAECSEQRGLLMARLTLPQWRLILADDARAGLINVLRTGEIDALAVFLAPYAPPEGTGRVVVTHHPRLVDALADDRDQLKPVGYDRSKPWDALAASIGNGAEASTIAEGLYHLHVAGEAVYWYTERAAAREMAVEALLAGPLSPPVEAVPVSLQGLTLFDNVEEPSGLAVFGSGDPVFPARSDRNKQGTGREGGEKHGANENKAPRPPG